MSKNGRTDWRLFSPDAHYKVGKATQAGGMGSSLFPFLAGYVMSILVAVGCSIPMAARITLTVVPLVIYYLAERYTGNLQNSVMEFRETMKAKFPFGRYSSWREPNWSRRGADLAKFGSNFFLVFKAGYQDITRPVGTKWTQKTMASAQAILARTPRPVEAA